MCSQDWLQKGKNIQFNYMRIKVADTKVKLCFCKTMSIVFENDYGV